MMMTAFVFAFVASLIVGTHGQSECKFDGQPCTPPTVAMTTVTDNSVSTAAATAVTPSSVGACVGRHTPCAALPCPVHFDCQSNLQPLNATCTDGGTRCALMGDKSSEWFAGQCVKKAEGSYACELLLETRTSAPITGTDNGQNVECRDVDGVCKVYGKSGKCRIFMFTSQSQNMKRDRVPLECVLDKVDDDDSSSQVVQVSLIHQVSIGFIGLIVSMIHFQ